MNTEQTDVKDDGAAFLDEMVGLYQKTLAEANEYLDREDRTRAAGITVCAAHRFAVVLDDAACGASVSLDADMKLCIKVVPGHLCGISLFTRVDAERVAALWSEKAPPSLQAVKVILDIDLVRARKADAEATIADLQVHAQRLQAVGS